MKKVVLVGCGYLGREIAIALTKGIVKGVELVGVYNRTFEKAQKLGDEVSVSAAESFEELMKVKPDYVIEAAGTEAVKEIAIASLQGGADLLILSTGAFCQKEFYMQVEECAEKFDQKVYLVPGAVGGFDILRAACLTGKTETTFSLQKFASTSGRTDPMTREVLDNFEGSVEELYEKMPRHLNVAVSTALVANGLQDTRAKIGTGDGVNFTITSEGEFGRTSIYTEMNGKNRKLIAYSAIYILQRLNTRITF